MSGSDKCRTTNVPHKNQPWLNRQGMPAKRFTVEVQPDFIERQSKTRPIEALAELIWNGLDADADTVTVSLSRNALGLTSITVADAGTGIPYADAEAVFGKLGGSWKQRGGLTKEKGRMLHGFEGRGRFKAFSLGRVVDWRIIYRADEGLRAYTVSILGPNLSEVRITDEMPVPDATSSGVEVKITELHRDFHSLEPDNSVQELSEIFALYLKDYRGVKISVEGVAIDPASVIATTKTFPLQGITAEGVRHPVELEIFEWRSATRRALYLCSEKGFPLSQVPTRFHVGDFQFSAYFKSSFISKLHKEGALQVAEVNPEFNRDLANSIDEAQHTIKNYFKDRMAEQSRSVVEAWKSDQIYPYKGDPKTPIEQAERQVFDIVATTVNNHLPDFAETPTKNKALQLRMLRSAIERSPDDLQLILREVIQLPHRQQEELARLLREASLSSIISAAKAVADRQKFLLGLEQILFDADMKARLKERSQLHKIVADNTWLFGEEFNIAVNDKGLTAALRQHRKLLGNEIVIDEPVKHVSKTRGIIDLMLSRTLRRHRADEVEHLVVELKAPKVPIDIKEITQIEQYAQSVAEDSRFRTADGVQWTFWVLSDDIGKHGQFRLKNSINGVILQSGNVTIGIKTWAQIIQENKARMQSCSSSKTSWNTKSMRVRRSAICRKSISNF